MPMPIILPATTKKKTQTFALTPILNGKTHQCQWLWMHNDACKPTFVMCCFKTEEKKYGTLSVRKVQVYHGSCTIIFHLEK